MMPSDESCSSSREFTKSEIFRRSFQRKTRGYDESAKGGRDVQLRSLTQVVPEYGGT